MLWRELPCKNGTSNTKYCSTGLDQVPPELDMSPSTPPGRTYRYLQPDPLYRFGFGLSYGIVSYANAAVTPTTAKAECQPSASDCGSVTVCAGETLNAYWLCSLMQFE